MQSWKKEEEDANEVPLGKHGKLKKTERATAADIAVQKPFALTGLPTRSRPMEFLAEFQALLDKLPQGRVVELDSAKITEHRARKYLAIMASKDPRYGDFLLRTGPSSTGLGRRRVWITNPASQATTIIRAGNPETTAQSNNRAIADLMIGGGGVSAEEVEA